MSKLNKKGYDMYINIIIAIALVALIYFFATSITSLLGVSDFSLKCATHVSMKSAYYTLPAALRTGTPPILHQVCPTESEVISINLINDTARKLYQMAASCWGSLGGNDLVTDEGNTLPCYIASFYTNEIEIPAEDMKTYFDSQNTTMKVIFVKYDDDTETIEFIDMSEDAENLPDDFQAEILFSDWKTYSDTMIPILDVPYIRRDTIWSYVKFSSRETKGNENEQNSRVVSAVTPSQLWESTIVDLARFDVMYDFILYRESIDGGNIDFPDIPGSVFDEFIEFLINTLGRGLIIDDLYSTDYHAPYYDTLSCGELMASMACCEDKVVICIKEP